MSRRRARDDVREAGTQLPVMPCFVRTWAFPLREMGARF